MHGQRTYIAPTSYVTSDRTFGLAEVSITYPCGWNSELHDGSTSVAGDIFDAAMTTIDGQQSRLQQAQLGSSFSAEVRANQTRIIIQAHEERLEQSVEACSQLLSGLRFDDKGLQRGLRQLSSQENAVKESAQALAHLGFRRARWPNGRARWGTGGNPRKRQGLTPEDVQQRWQHILSHPALITAVGSHEPTITRAVQQCTDHLSNFSLPETRSERSDHAAPEIGQSVHIPTHEAGEALLVALELPTHISGRERAVLELLNFALTGGFMGALYHRLRTVMHLIYGVSAHTTLGSDYPAWMIQTTPTPGKSGEVLDALPHALDELETRFRGVHFESLIERFIAHQKHHRIGWKARFNQMRADLEEGRPPQERARIAGRVQDLTAEDALQAIRRWTQPHTQTTTVHVGQQRPGGKLWSRMDINDLLPNPPDQNSDSS